MRETTKIGPRPRTSLIRDPDVLRQHARRNHRSDAQTQFVDALGQCGLELTREGLVADGHIHRCHVRGKGQSNRSGTYRLHLNHGGGIAVGGFRNWTDQQGWQKWKQNTDRPLTTAEPDKNNRAGEAAQGEFKKDRARRQAKARVKAARLWGEADDASAEHPYCRRKKVEPRRLAMMRFKDGNSLLVPMLDEKDDLQNLQFIRANGNKTFLTGGRAAGSHHWVAEPDDDGSKTICVCEGWATGESIFQATGHAVMLAFSAQHLKAVAEWVRKRYPEHRLVICADDDWKTKGNPGVTFAREAARAVGGFLAVPEFGEKRADKDTDFNDMMITGGLDAMRRVIEGASPLEQEAGAAEQGKQEKKEKQALVLLNLAPTVQKGGLFRTKDHVGYADIVINGHRETWRIRSTSFRRWLVHGFYMKTGEAPTAEAVRAAIEMIEARAQFEEGVPIRDVHVRVAGHGGKIYLDLCDEQWRVVQISVDSWCVIGDPPVRFQRADGMLPLPVPTKNDPVDAASRLWSYLNIKAKNEFVLLIAWLLAAWRDCGPYPVLVLLGEEGSTKSTLVKLIRALIDPNKAPLRALPREDRDLFIAANNGYVLAYDNVSKLPYWISDTLCRLATGGGFATRSLYTNQDEVIFQVMRPTILNGIEEFVTRSDLADRSIILHLNPIADDDRRAEKELWTSFEADAPGILGGLLDAMVHGLRILPTIHLDSMPRMADFALWATACLDALWSPGTFINAYQLNRNEAIADVIDADLVAVALRAFMAEIGSEWQGTATELLRELAMSAGELQTKNRAWPGSPRALRGALQRAAAPLRKAGIVLDFNRKSNARTIIIRSQPVTSGKSSSAPSSASLFEKSNDLRDTVPPIHRQAKRHRSRLKRNHG